MCMYVCVYINFERDTSVILEITWRVGNVKRGRILLSKAGYASHRKSHQGQFMQTPGTNNVSCAICNKVCNTKSCGSAAGLMSHLRAHERKGSGGGVIGL